MLKPKHYLMAMLLALLMSLPAASGSSILPPSNAQKNVQIIQMTAKQVGVELAICLAIARTENDKFDASAVNENKSGRGADDIRVSIGLYQITPATGRAFGVQKAELRIPRRNAEGGIKYIKYLLDKYPRATLSAIAEMYNLGETRFAAGATAHAYAKRFMKYYRLYSQGPQQLGA